MGGTSEGEPFRREERQRAVVSSAPFHPAARKEPGAKCQPQAPMGFPQRKAALGGALSPRKRLSYSLRPAFEDATDGKEKNHASAGC